MNNKKANAQACLDICYSIFSGKIGIRTLDTVARILHFECSAIDHSAIFPRTQRNNLSIRETQS